MTSPARVEANRRNAQMSTGPRSVPGKTSSAGNSRTHGLTAGLEVEEADPDFAARLAAWEEEVRPQSVEARFALRKAVAATFRIERCESAYWAATAEYRDRAREAWDEDRWAEAADLLGRLSRRPGAVSRRLATSSRGVAALLGLWDRLGRALEANAGAWSDEEVAAACDLLGIPADLRRGPLPFDPAEGSGGDLLSTRRAFVAEEAGRLRRAMEGRLEPLDAIERARAESGALAMLAEPVRRVIRYEAMAWRCYRESLAAAKAPGSSPADVVRNPPRDLPETPPREATEAEPTSPRDDGVFRRASTESLPTVATARAPRGPSPTPEEFEAILADPERESFDGPEPALAVATASASAPCGGLNRHQRRRREALARRSG